MFACACSFPSYIYSTAHNYMYSLYYVPHTASFYYLPFLFLPINSVLNTFSMLVYLHTHARQLVHAQKKAY